MHHKVKWFIKVDECSVNNDASAVKRLLLCWMINWQTNERTNERMKDRASSSIIMIVALPSHNVPFINSCYAHKFHLIFDKFHHTFECLQMVRFIGNDQFARHLNFGKEMKKFLHLLSVCFQPKSNVRLLISLSA